MPRSSTKTPGRPTAYRRAFCERVIALGAKGMSKAQMAAELGVSRRTLANWEEEHEEFLHAIAHARDLAQAWWEAQAQKHLVEKHQGSKLNSQLWSRSMAARFPDDYRENRKLELSGALEIGKLSDAELDAELARLAALTAAATDHGEGDSDGSA